MFSVCLVKDNEMKSGSPFEVEALERSRRSLATFMDDSDGMKLAMK